MAPGVGIQTVRLAKFHELEGILPRKYYIVVKLAPQNGNSSFWPGNHREGAQKEPVKK
jgi:hypothetical protein